MNGAFQLGTGIQFKSFTDGLSVTILVGEKHVRVGTEGRMSDCSLYNGEYQACSTRAASRDWPPTTDVHDTGWKFGSRHASVQFCFADGRVQGIFPTIDPYTYELLGSRSDGEVTPDF